MTNNKGVPVNEKWFINTNLGKYLKRNNNNFKKYGQEYKESKFILKKPTFTILIGYLQK